MVGKSELLNSFQELERRGSLRIWTPDLARFERDHRRNACVEFDPLYGLPSELFEKIAEHLPRWLTDEEMLFERDLSILCSRHFAVGVQFGLPATHAFFHRATTPVINSDEFAKLGWGQFTTLERANDGLRIASARLDPVHERLEAYVGWLLVNPTFRQERDRLRERWKSAITRLRAFPAYPVKIDVVDVVTAKKQGVDATSEFVDDFNAFYQRWHLRRLATWDLPEPLGVNLGGPASLAPLLGLEQQSSIQLSPVVALPTRYPVREILDEGADKSEHLAEWHAAKDHQVQRHQRIFQLQFLRETVLGSRYRSRFAGHIEQLDEAFADYFGGLSTDAVKKLRLLPPSAK